ncbi:MAG TPA: DUF4245 domain-containing protein [Micromonosporaceae bacterium]
MTTTEPASPPTVNTAALRLSRTPGDMLKATLVLLVPVAILFALYVFFFGGNNVIRIDPSQSYADARTSAHFTVLQPAGLSDAWKPVSSQFQPGATSMLRVGYVSPHGDGIQLIETNEAATLAIDSELGNVGSVARSVDAGGRSWGLVDAKGSNLALVDTEAGRTVIITGDASQSELQQFAASLR